MNKTFEQRFINILMREGKYIKAEKIFMAIISKLKESGIKNVYKYVRKSIYNITPIIGIGKKKKKRKEFVKPIFLTSEKAEKYAITWLLKRVERKKVSNFILKIVSELKDAYNETGSIFKEKLELYQQVRNLTKSGKKKIQKVFDRRTKLKYRYKRRKWLKFGKL